MGTKVNGVGQSPVCWFKYKPSEEKLIIQCQPIKPYSMIDRLQVDTFEKSNPGFKGGVDESKPSI